MNVEELIRRGRLIDQGIDEMEARHKEELKPLQEAMKTYRNLIQEWMIANKMVSTKTPAGQAVLATKTSFRVEDQQEFKRHVIGSEDWELIVWAVKRSAAEAFEEATKTLPPGVAKSSVLELRLLAPEKKRVRKPTQVEGVPFDPFADEDRYETHTDETSNTEAAQ